MKRIIRLVIKRPKLVFIALLLITAAAISQLGKLNVNVDSDGLMLANDPNRAFYEATQETFGSDNISVVFIEDKQLFTTEKLQLIQEVASQLKAIEGVVKVNSLFTLRNFKHSPGGLKTTLFFEPIPESAGKLEELRRDVLRNPFARNLISPDGTAMAINIHARNDSDDPDFDSRLSEAITQTLAPLKKEIVTFGSSVVPFERVFQIGMPYTRKILGETIINDQDVLIPLAIVAFLISLAFRLRSFSGIIVPLLTASLSIVWTLGFMGATGLPINILTVIVPVLIIVMGSTKDIHLLNQYTEELHESNDKNKALLSMGCKLSLAFFLSFIIIYLSFFSVAFNNINILQQFGLVASTAFLFNFIVTVSLVPLYLLAFGSRQSTEEKKPSIFERLADAMLQVEPPHRTTMLAISTLLCLVIGSGAVWVKINNSPRAFFNQDSLIQTRSNILAERLTGIQTFTIIFSAENEEAFKDPGLLKEIKKVQDFIKQMKLFDASLSLADLLSLINREMQDGDDQYFRIPASIALINQYLSDFLSSSDTEQYVSADFRQATIQVWHHLSASYDLSRALGRLKEFTDTLDKRLEVRVTGEEILTNAAAESMLVGQAKSLLSLIIIIFVMISVLFMSFKAGLIALAPNLISVFILFGLMGYLDIPLDIGTVMIAVIAIGIGMNYTVHFMVRYNEEIREMGNEKLAMERMIRTEIAAIITTSIALCLGFGVLMAASLSPVINFGGLTALLMLAALIANLFVTPTLLASMRFVTLWDMATVNVGRKIIDSCELFKGMHSWQIKQIILMSQVQNVQAGDVFIKQGAIGHEMFVILEGQVRVERVASDGRTQTLGHVHEGNVIGEVALVSQEERMANVVAETDVKLLVLEWKALEQLGRFLPMISTRLFLNIARIIGKRLVDKE